MAKKEDADKRSADKNTKGPAINYPKKDEIAPAVLKEQAEIKLTFTDEEIVKKAKQLVKTSREKTALELEKKMEAEKFASLIAAKETTIEALKKEIEDGAETKNVICEIKRNFTTQKREYWYKDEKVKEEPLRKTDHQLDLDIAEGKMKVVKSFEGKVKVGDYVKTKKGAVIKIIFEDLPTLTKDYIEKNIEGYATQDEINTFEAAAKSKQKK